MDKVRSDSSDDEKGSSQSLDDSSVDKKEALNYQLILAVMKNEALNL